MFRISKDDYYLGIAQAVAQRSTCLRRQYGAVIVKDDEIISTGYNGAPRHTPNCCDTGVCSRKDHAHNDGNYSDCPAVHAEMNAIISAARRDMIGSTLYLFGLENGKTIEAIPCPICARMIKNAGIQAVVGSKPFLPRCKKCGGQAKVVEHEGCNWVYCESCNSSTYHFDTPDQALDAWRRMNASEGSKNASDRF